MKDYNYKKIDPKPDQSSVQGGKKMSKHYDHQAIEKKWQKVWDKTGLHQAVDFDKRPKKYILVEFPYLSGDGLHVGHVRSYVALDALSRKKRMDGYNVLYPIGWDAFGLPTENYAIKTGTNPVDITKKNISLFKRQLKSLGLSFDWGREINTSDPKYYKWTQWIFLKLYEKGLAYTAKIPINWCNSCKIGLANEEVIDGKCERCGNETKRREQRQWMLKITSYADKLLKGLDGVDYLEKIKAQQINWIGKSEGMNIRFKIENTDEYINVFTTRADTIFGVTAMVIAPEHEIIENYKLKIENWDEVKKYIKKSNKKSDLERTDLAKEKTGIFTGSYCINPINNEKVPIWVGDYVIATYGGGAVMVVPAHDKRDYQLARKYGLKIRQVIKPPSSLSFRGSPKVRRGISSTILKAAYTDYGILVNSGKFNGIDSKQAIEKISNWLKKRNLGKKTIQYKLRDWVFSRQHYWGEPIPLIFCASCKRRAEDLRFKDKISGFNKGELLNPGWIAVPEKDLPVKLPYVKIYKPTETGESPLANIKDWVNVKCPKCKGSAKRETDTMPNWAGSNWYFLRYIDPKNNKSLADLKKIKYWMPVDLYNGGMEHTTLHLLYSRFWHKFLYEIGVVHVDEPYVRRVSHGMVLSEDGRKMSKSFGNVVNPDDIVEQYGADVLRLYEMFMGPFDQAILWDPKTIEGVNRFLIKVRNLIADCGLRISDLNKENKKNHQSVEQLKHKTIKKVGEDLENMKFNTAIACLMEYTNELIKYKKYVCIDHIKILILLLAPFAPHVSEELWHQIHPKLSKKQSIFREKWPRFNSMFVKGKNIELVIQINGKIRDKVNAAVTITQKQAEKLVMPREKVKKYTRGKNIKKIVFVPGKLINFVI